MKSIMTCRWLRVLLLIIAVQATASTKAAGEGSPPVLCDRIDLLREHGQLTVRGQAIKAVTLIPELYGRTGHGLVWRDETKILALITAVEDSRLDGLIPADYHHETLAAMLRDYRAGLMSACERADFDILLTDALVRLGYHYLFGKVNPKNLDEDWNLSRDIDGRDPVDITLSIINGESLQQGLATLIPDTDIYLKMKRALATYRAIAARGGWPALPAGPTLRPGMQSDRLTAIRNRLQITGDLASGPSEDPSNYDVTLLEAVRHFQRRHMLEPDGIIGEKTREAMNVPVAARVDQIRVNMERARWVFRHVPEEYLITDIAGFRVLYIRHGQIVWTAPAQVGRPFRKTPVFQDTLKYLVFNPTWTVPPTILKNDVLPMIQHDPGYLEKKNMLVIDANNSIVDPSTIDWARVTAESFPYQIRQGPGPENALGRVKFMFPNKHLVYLHDTPHKSGFKPAERAFSSGCIRIERPFELAELLLDDPQRWNRRQIEQLVEQNQTRTVNLSRQIPVFLLYWTVDADNTDFYFKADVYNRDNAILDALNGAFKFEPPDSMPAWFLNSRREIAQGWLNNRLR